VRSLKPIPNAKNYQIAFFTAKIPLSEGFEISAPLYHDTARTSQAKQAAQEAQEKLNAWSAYFCGDSPRNSILSSC
jgi:hypothetical protein